MNSVSLLSVSGDLPCSLFRTSLPGSLLILSVGL